MTASDGKCKTPNCPNPAIARDLCRSCYDIDRRERMARQMERHEGLVPVPIKGWGCRLCLE